MTLINYEIIHEQIALVTLNRPEASNAMSKALLDELNVAIDNVNNNRSVRVLLISGAGTRAFCAGADLKERKRLSNDEVIQTVRYIRDTISNIERMKIPVIALINGAAIGGGLELALACDIRLAYKHATFGLTETSLAIIPGAGGTQRLPRLIGIGQAKRLIYSSKVLTAEEALNIGLIEEIMDESEEIQAIQLARDIAKNGPIAVQQAKLAINTGIQSDLKTGLEIEQLCYQSTLYTEDRIEGLQAFQEKRRPNYRGK